MPQLQLTLGGAVPNLIDMVSSYVNVNLGMPFGKLSLKFVTKYFCSKIPWRLNVSQTVMYCCFESGICGRPISLRALTAKTLALGFEERNVKF